MKGKWVKRILLLGFWPLGYFLSSIAAHYPQQVEMLYSMGFSKEITTLLSRITGMLSFSLAEVLVMALGLTIIIIIIFNLIRMIVGLISKRRDKYNRKKYYIFSCFYSLAVFLGIIYFTYMMIWGLNYQRLSFAEIAGLKTGDFTVQELEDLCDCLIDRANSLRTGLKEDAQGIMMLEGGFDAVCAFCPQAYTRVAEIYPELSGIYGKPKPVLMSKWMSYIGISGIYFPFTGEANVNTDIPDFLLPATACHEMAHQRGFAREDEANYLAWLACNCLDNHEFQYSGTMLALIHVMNKLYEEDPEAAIKCTEKYSEGVTRDLLFMTAYWKQFEGRAEEITSSVNDVYLKSNRQEEGIKSYGRMVDLLLATQRDQKNNKFFKILDIDKRILYSHVELLYIVWSISNQWIIGLAGG